MNNVPRQTYEFAELDVEVLLQLKRLGYQPRVIFDVGASNGFWSYQAHSAFSDAEYHLFEPLVDHVPEYKRLMEENLRSHPSFVLHKLAVGDKTGEAIISLHRDPSGSSTLATRPDPRGLKLLKTMTRRDDPATRSIPIPMATLDDLVRDGTVPTPSLVKMDVQGGELGVLKGAERILSSVDALLVETWIYRGYGEETPLLTEIAVWLSRFGFSLWELGDSHRDPDGLLIATDCWFLNSASMARFIRYGLPRPRFDTMFDVESEVVAELRATREKLQAMESTTFRRLRRKLGGILRLH